MSESGLAKKLVIKPNNRVLIINPPEGFIALLGDLPEGARMVEQGPADVVHLFAGTRAELEEQARTAVESVIPGGVLWISYPKVSSGRSDLSRDTLWPILQPFDWRPVSQVSIDDTWSALRFRPTADVKSKHVSAG